MKENRIHSLLIALMLILASVSGFVSCSGRQGAKGAVSRPPMLMGVVPPDAAAVFSWHDMRKGFDYLCDNGQPLRALSGPNAAFRRLISCAADSLPLKNAPMALSVHYSGSFTPVLLLQGSHERDTGALERSLEPFAKSLGLCYSSVPSGGRNVLLVSPSRTLLMSAERNLEYGYSVLSDDSFAALASSFGQGDALFLNHKYAGRFAGAVFSRPDKNRISAIRKASDWTALSLKAVDGVREGAFACQDDPRYLVNFLESATAFDPQLPKVLPVSSFYARSVGVAPYEEYLSSKRSYLDANHALKRFEARCDTIARRDSVIADPVTILRESGIVEAATVSGRFPSLDSLWTVALLRLPPKRNYADNYSTSSEFLSLLFGEDFAMKGQLQRSREGEWLVIGTAESLQAYTDALSEGVAADLPFASSAFKKVSSLVWFSAPDALSLKRKALSGEFAKYLKSAPDAPKRYCAVVRGSGFKLYQIDNPAE